MSETAKEEFARTIAEDVATYEQARATLRDTRDWSPILDGLVTGFVVSAAIFFISPESSSPLWIQIIVGLAGIWAVIACIFLLRKYRQLRRAIEVILAKQDARL